MKKRFTILACLMALIWASVPVNETRASEPPVILISPFHVVSSDQTAVIQQGIDALLSSRLVSEACPVKLVKDMGQPVSDVDSARAATETHHGDFLVYGIVVKFATTVTVDVFLFDRAKDKTVLHSHDTGEGDAVLLTLLSSFSQRVMDHLAEPCYPALPDEASMPAPSQAHTEKTVSSISVWKSPAIEGDIVGLCAMDITGDNRPEFIIARSHDLIIRTFDQGKLLPRQGFTPEKNMTILGVDCADLNRNGTPEIFLSMVRDDRISLDSLILEWDGSKFKTLASDLPWVFRSQGPDPENNPVILIQKNKSLSSILGGTIQRLATTETGGYSPSDAVPVPKNLASVFSLGISHDASGAAFAIYNYKNLIQMNDATMAPTWESDETYGGGVGYLALKDSHDSDKTNRLYLEPRLLFLDLDGDRKNELIAVKNHEISNHLFSGFRYYKKGRIVYLKHGDMAWHPVFETENITGYISDVAFADTDGDKQPELIYAVANRGNKFISKNSGHIIVQKWTYR